jgi:hypothetical protein
MAEFRGHVRKVERKRKIPRICPPGKHWVEGHYASGKSGFSIRWVQGHCEKDGTPPEMQVTRIETNNKYNIFHLYKRETKIVKEPLNVNPEEETKGHDI